MSGHQEYKCPKCRYEWETLDAPKVQHIVGRLRSTAKQLTKLAALFDGTEVHDYKWNVEEAESFLSRTADTIVRRYRNKI